MASPQGQTDTTIEVEIVDGLKAIIFEHTFTADIVCWTFVSQGLASHGQKEVVFTVRKLSALYPQDPLRWYCLLLGHASHPKRPRIVDKYDIAELNFDYFLGHPNLRMILYIPQQALLGLTAAQEARLPHTRLHTVMLTADEFETYKEEGLLRILTNFARLTRHYPFPPWFDPSRQSLLRPSDFAGSIMKRLRAYSIPGISATFDQKSGDITVTVSPRAYHNKSINVIEHLDSVLRLQLEPNDHSPGCFVWHTGQQGVKAVGRHSGNVAQGKEDMVVNDMKLSLCNIIFCPQQDKIDFLFAEDGYTVFLTNPAWFTIRSALINRAPVSIACTRSRSGRVPSLHINILETTFINPVDGLSYIAPEGWQQFKPNPTKTRAGKRPRGSNKRIEMGRVVLLSNPSPSDCDADKLADWMVNLTNTMENQLANTPIGPPVNLILQTSIVRNSLKQLVLMHSETDHAPSPAEVQALQRLTTALRQVPIPGGVRNITFQIEVDMVKGIGDGAFY
ncbi:hypothetical protein CPB86DRAFT_873256 [Serendipita vermifera]|nr:hypothetical protein CPB86DRAFT_873256 [Serendipita vermifera]